MKIEYIQADYLKRYNNNAKDHPDKQVAEIAKSIEKFGFRQPIVVDSNYVIVIGHGRWLAAKKLGIKQVPVTIIDDLSEDEINALRLVDNRLNESAWDFSALEDELATITGIDMTDFGFEPITEADIAQVTTRPVQAPETAPEREWYDDGPTYAETAQNGPERPVEGPERLETLPVTQRTPLQATTDYRDSGYGDAQGRKVEGERSLIEADGGPHYRYRCPRCKHLFN